MVDELVKTIQLIKSADFKVEDINVDLHKRVAAAISQGKCNSHNMRESDIDWNFNWIELKWQRP